MCTLWAREKLCAISLGLQLFSITLGTFLDVSSTFRTTNLYFCFLMNNQQICLLHVTRFSCGSRRTTQFKLDAFANSRERVQAETLVLSVTFVWQLTVAMASSGMCITRSVNWSDKLEIGQLLLVISVWAWSGIALPSIILAGQRSRAQHRARMQVKVQYGSTSWLTETSCLHTDKSHCQKPKSQSTYISTTNHKPL
jgi:hypothetical protein